MDGTDQADAVLQLFRERKYAEAADLAEPALRAGVGIGRITGLRSLVAESEVFFRRVFEVLNCLESPSASRAAENLADVLGSMDRVEEAIALRRRFYDVKSRDTLALLYRRLGNEEAAQSLYAETGVCEHLLPVQQALMADGAKIQYCGQPWSSNCHIWVYFDRALNCEGLIIAHALPECVQIHDHRGTHDGSERGLVCTEHQDGLMGRYPAVD
jgi:hypothetical protein